MTQVQNTIYSSDFEWHFQRVKQHTETERGTPKEATIPAPAEFQVLMGMKTSSLQIQGRYHQPTDQQHFMF